MVQETSCKSISHVGSNPFDEASQAHDIAYSQSVDSLEKRHRAAYYLVLGNEDAKFGERSAEKRKWYRYDATSVKSGWTIYSQFLKTGG